MGYYLASYMDMVGNTIQLIQLKIICKIENFALNIDKEVSVVLYKIFG